MKFTVELTSYEDFCYILDERTAYDQGETFKALKHSVQDKLDADYKKIGKMTISAGDEFEVIETMNHDVVFKGVKGIIVLAKSEADNIFQLQ